MTHEVKTAIKHNSRVYRKWANRAKNPNDQDQVCQVRNCTNKRIKEAKLANYTNLGNKLSDPQIRYKHLLDILQKKLPKKK